MIRMTDIMCRGLGNVVIAFVIVCCCRESASLKDVILSIEPQVVQRGGNSTLSCSYDLEDAQLYTVKWYRGNREFYRYTPSEHPSTKILPFKGNIPISVDLHESNEHRVVLRNVEFHLSGNFSCEVTTEGPFLTIVANNHMIVVVKPESSALLSTEQSFYDPGDILKANCSTAPSRPAATISFILNNVVVCERCELRKNPVEDLFWSEMSLQLPLFPSHFDNSGRLMLRCVAQVAGLYLQETERRLDRGQTKDPIPARVTFPNRAIGTHHTQHPAILLCILATLMSIHR